MEEAQALAILADPDAPEDQWFAASQHVTKNLKQSVRLRSADQDFTDISCGSIAGLLVTFSCANFTLLSQNYWLTTLTYLFLANTGMVYLSATRRQRRTKFLVIFSLSLSISFFLTALISFLFPPGWRF